MYYSRILAWEREVVPRATLNDLDMQLVEEYLARRPNRSKSAGRLSKVEKGMLSREDRYKLVLTYVHEHGSITRQEYMKLAHIAGNLATQDLAVLVEQGSLRMAGQTRSRRYVL